MVQSQKNKKKDKKVLKLIRDNIKNSIDKDNLTVEPSN